MGSARSFNAVVTGWAAQLASGQRLAFTQSAQRFAALLSSESELEVARPQAPGGSTVPASLKIDSGLHAGAFLKLTGTEYLIGCAEDCDIVLRDAHIADHHCRLVRGWAGFSVRDLRSKGAQLVSPAEVKYDGGSIEVRYEVGGLRFMIRQPPPAEAPREGTASRDKVPALRTALLASVLVILGSVVVLATAEQMKRHRTAVSAQPPASAVAANGRMARLVEQVRVALADGHVKVELRDDRILVEGSTTNTSLKARIQALAADLRATVPVEDHLSYVAVADEEGPSPLPVRVQSVMAGSPAYFITDTGARYFIGAVLSDGAEVVAISAGEIRFTRGGRPIVYKLQ